MTEHEITIERPSDWEILWQLVLHFDAEPQQVCEWLATFNPTTARRELCASLGVAHAGEPNANQ